MKKLSLLLAAILCSVSLAACSGSGDQNASGGSTQNNSSEEDRQGSDSQEADSSDGEPSQGSGKTDVTVALEADVATLHPANYTTTAELNVLRQVFDTALFTILDGSSDHIEDRVAESYEVSDDGLVYTYKIREDVRFHDGSALTAEDLKFSIELFQDSPYQDSWVEGIEQVEAEDDYTLVVTLGSQYAPYESNFTQVLIVPKEYYESVGEDEFSKNPVGCGPYKFVSHAAGDSIVLEAFDDYYRGVPEIQNITYKVMSDSSARAIALQTGEIDLAPIASSDYASLEGEAEVVIKEVPSTSYCFVTMNQTVAPFDNQQVRQAVAYAINRQDIIDIALDGFGTENSIIISPMVFGYSDDLPKYEYNPEKAQELLAEAGIDTPYDLGTLVVAEKYIKEATVLQENLAAVGLETTIETLEFNAFLAQTMGGDFGISVLGLTFEPDPTQHSLLYTPEYIGGPNMSQYQDEEVSQWFEEAVQSADEGERAGLYKNIFTKVQEDAAYPAIYNPIYLYGHNTDYNIEININETYYIYDSSWK